MAISISQGTRTTKSITVWLDGLNPKYEYNDRYLEYYIRESGTEDYILRTRENLPIQSGIEITLPYIFSNLEPSTSYDIKIKIVWKNGRDEDQEFYRTIWTLDPIPKLQRFTCTGAVNDDDDWLMAECDFVVDNILENRTEYTISARVSDGVDKNFYPKTGENLYDYSLTEINGTAKGRFKVRLNSSTENKIYDFMLTIKIGENEYLFYDYKIEVTFNLLGRLETKQVGGRNPDGTYQVEFTALIRKNAFYRFDLFIQNTNTDESRWLTYEEVSEYKENDLYFSFDDFKPGSYYASLGVTAYETQEAYQNDEVIFNGTARNISFLVEGPPVDYFEWTSSMSGQLTVDENKEIHPVTAEEWRSFLAKLSELKQYLEEFNMTFDGFPESFTIVNSGDALTPSIYNEAVNALESLSYSAGVKYPINRIGQTTVLSASLFINLRDQFNFLIDEI